MTYMAPCIAFGVLLGFALMTALEMIFNAGHSEGVTKGKANAETDFYVKLGKQRAEGATTGLQIVEMYDAAEKHLG